MQPGVFDSLYLLRVIHPSPFFLYLFMIAYRRNRLPALDLYLLIYSRFCFLPLFFPLENFRAYQEN